MKKKELDQFRKMPLEGVEKEIKRLKEKLVETRVDILSAKETNFKAAKGIRNDIAQLLTLKTIKKTKTKKS